MGVELCLQFTLVRRSALCYACFHISLSKYAHVATRIPTCAHTGDNRVAHHRGRRRLCTVGSCVATLSVMLSRDPLCSGHVVTRELACSTCVQCRVVCHSRCVLWVPLVLVCIAHVSDSVQVLTELCTHQISLYRLSWD